MAELMILDVKYSETINILCYEGNYMTLYENEKDLYHFYKIKPFENSIIDTIKKVDILEYVLYINENLKELEFYNFDDGDSILFNYLEIEDTKYDYEQIISEKIKYLIDKNNKLSENLINVYKNIKNTYNYFYNELENVDRKISFFEKSNKIKNQYKNIGKKEIIEIIVDKLDKIK